MRLRRADDEEFAGFVVRGENTGDRSGARNAGVGDVNGDGFMDMVLGVPGAAGGAGRSYVVFGSGSPHGPVELSDVAAGRGGFVIQGAEADDSAGIFVSGAGDLNGDGLADLLVSAPGDQPPGQVDAGRSYVVFGRTSTDPVDLGEVTNGQGGWRIEGQADRTPAGGPLAGVGDVNGDGVGDFLVGAPGAPVPDTYYAGRSFVVFGSVDGRDVQLSDVASGQGGFAISGSPPYDFQTGVSIAGAGDVNGDGLADLIVATPLGSDSAGSYEGRAYVVFGKSDGTEVALSDIAAGDGGFLIKGSYFYDRIASNVAGAGDVNGDGLSDMIVSGGAYSSEDYVVFGRTATTPVDVHAMGSEGYIIHGSGFDELAGAGDLNADGLADLLLGTGGETFVAYGKRGPETVHLDDLRAGVGGFGLVAQRGGDAFGSSVASLGDLDGDGLGDVLIGAARASTPAHEYAGRSYVLLGGTSGVFADSAIDQLGGSGPDSLVGSIAADALAGGAGNDTLAGLGGADVLYGGAGDDLIRLEASNLQALAAAFGQGGNDAQLARVDGGTGFDTLQLDGAGLLLDLHQIGDPGGWLPGGCARLASIERIDLTGLGHNTLKLAVADVNGIAGMNLINAGNQAALGWRNGSYQFETTEQRHQLVVDGDAGDQALSAPGAWHWAGNVFHGDTAYDVYNSRAGLAQVLVAEAVSVPGEAQRDGGRVAGGVAGGMLLAADLFDDGGGEWRLGDGQALPPGAQAMPDPSLAIHALAPAHSYELLRWSTHCVD